MRKILICISLCLLLVAVGALSCCIGKDSDGEDDTDTKTDNVVYEKNECVKSSNTFAFKMYGKLSAGGDQNVFFSPYSISTAVGMAYEGANGQTAAEIRTVLDLPEENATRLQMTKDVQASLCKEGVSYELDTANAYWLAQGGTLKPNYKTAIEDYYLASGQQLDFAGNPEGSVDTINTWVEGKTNDRIKDLLSTDDIELNTYLILTNAIYFKSDWQYQFKADATQNKTFTTSAGPSVVAPTMHMCDSDIGINYSESDEAQMIELPYKDKELSMYVILPKESSTTELELELDYAYLADLKSDISPSYVDIHMPKFKFETKYNLNEQLKALGMPTAFGWGANFSGITDDCALYISKVIHQAFVAVDEEGTEAAAATAVIMRNYSADDEAPTPIEFKADHPFIFLIEHKETGEILFMGKVGDPTA